jgi:hypothetical protein
MISPKSSLGALSSLQFVQFLVDTVDSIRARGLKWESKESQIHVDENLNDLPRLRCDAPRWASP